MDFFDSTKSIVENLYLLSGPILTLLAVAGIVQLFLTKKTLIINSQRDAANLAAQQLRDYCERVIPTLNKYDISLRKEKIQDVDIEIGEFSRQYLEKKLGKPRLKEIVNERLKLLYLQLNALNTLESFSIYFVKGIADEQIAYSSVGRTFCFSVEKYYFDIAFSRSKDDNAFQNIIDLYKLWRSRLDKEKLTKEQEDLLRRLNNINVETIDPIGTK
jgi:hypothetical protein